MASDTTEPPQRAPTAVVSDLTPPATPTATSADPAIEAVLLALDDERKARAFYLAVLARHGEARPFVNIAPAEHRHAGHLITILEARGIPVPPDTHEPDAFDVPETRAACCELAIQSERDNIALYDELMAQAAGDDEVLAAFDLLRDRSLTRHLPAFERCASGQGQRRGGGRGGS